jgi:hypothetical protein
MANFLIRLANYLKSVIVASYISSIYPLALDSFCLSIYLASLKLEVLIGLGLVICKLLSYS